MPWFKKNPDLTNNPLYLEPRVTANETSLAQNTSAIAEKAIVKIFNTIPTTDELFAGEIGLILGSVVNSTPSKSIEITFTSDPLLGSPTEVIYNSKKYLSKTFNLGASFNGTSDYFKFGIDFTCNSSNPSMQIAYIGLLDTTSKVMTVFVISEASNKTYLYSYQWQNIVVDGSGNLTGFGELKVSTTLILDYKITGLHRFEISKNENGRMVTTLKNGSLNVLSTVESTTSMISAIYNRGIFAVINQTDSGATPNASGLIEWLNGGLHLVAQEVKTTGLRTADYTLDNLKVEE